MWNSLGSFYILAILLKACILRMGIITALGILLGQGTIGRLHISGCRGRTVKYPVHFTWSVLLSLLWCEGSFSDFCECCQHREAEQGVQGPQTVLVSLSLSWSTLALKFIRTTPRYYLLHPTGFYPGDRIHLDCLQQFAHHRQVFWLGPESLSIFSISCFLCQYWGSAIGFGGAPGRSTFNCLSANPMV